MKLKKRLLAALLASAMMLQTTGSIPIQEVEAASSVTLESSINLLENSDFEDTSVALEPHSSGDKLNKWSNYKDSVKKVQKNAHTGEWAVEFTESDSSLEQDSNDLQAGITYEAKVWAKVTGTGTKAYLGVKNYGGDEVKVLLDSAEYKEYTVPFTYTDTSKNPRVYVWVETIGSGAVYVDDFSMMSNGDLKTVSVENGKIFVEYQDSYKGTPSKEDFTAVATSSLDKEKNAVTFTEESMKDRKLELIFEPFHAEAIEQTIQVDLTYVPNNQTIRLDYKIASNGEEVLTAKPVSAEISNGKAVITLDQAPTLAPTVGDFSMTKAVNAGDPESLEISGFVYDKTAKTVTLEFQSINASTEEQEVTVAVTYRGETVSGSFRILKNEGKSYYVDAENGNDENDGLSPEKAIRSIEKVNTIQFQPGDQILFHCGQTWTGALKPQGSGTKGNPIVIKSYGKGSKPVLKPGADWKIPYFNVANKVISNPMVNNVISFYNQEYWEVRDLELYDPSYASNASTTVYRRGINISAEDVGDLYYFVFDNLTIHGFRGPNDNNGKSSGGIIMTVYSNPYDASKRVPTAVHEITVTNCTMYDLGRSGFNFVSPWTTRTGEEWQPFDYAGYGEWKPFEDIYIANNTVYNIDGDGILIDNCEDVVVEHNLVYRTVINCWYGVGIFNWNSNNTKIQFNEVYDTFPADSLLGAGDGQGIEIDALNKDTWVQYNYVHDNSGGSIMWCCADKLTGFNGVFRYNIFENDLTKHGVIDWRWNHQNSMAYNNTFYYGKLPEGVESREFFRNGYANGTSDAKFYNNIFYNLDHMTISTFDEEEIDWENNIFYGFDRVPDNDSAVITADPKFVNPGAGTVEGLKGYQLQADSPAINAGMEIADNGGRDYFGTKLSDGKTDIGAVEYTADETCTHKHLTDVLEVKVTCTENGMAAHKVCDDCGRMFVNGQRVYAKDLLIQAKGHQWSEWTQLAGTNTEKRACESCFMEETRKITSLVIPHSEMTATAGNYHTDKEQGNASLAIDGSNTTMWHTDWYPNQNAGYEDHWIQVELSKEYMVDAFEYVPRTSGSNGIITKYKILVSLDGETWTEADAGTWENDHTTKKAEFDPVQAKYVRLKSEEAESDQENMQFSSAAEINVYGTEKKAEIIPEVPMFEDVQNKDSFYYTPVYWAAGEGVTSGKEKNLFDPKGDVTRGEMVTFLWRLSGKPETAKADLKFTDVKSEKFYAKAVLWASSEGIVQGTSATTFSPNDPVTRAQVATFLYRYANGEASRQATKFTDVKEGKYYYEAVAWAAENEITKGSTDGTYRPNDTCNRGEAVAFIYRTNLLMNP